MPAVPEPDREDRWLRTGGLSLRGGAVLEVHGAVGWEWPVSMQSHRVWGSEGVKDDGAVRETWRARPHELRLRFGWRWVARGMSVSRSTYVASFESSWLAWKSLSDLAVEIIPIRIFRAFQQHTIWPSPEMIEDELDWGMQSVRGKRTFQKKRKVQQSRGS